MTLNDIALPSLEELTSSCLENSALILVPGLRLAFLSITIGLWEDKGGPRGWEDLPLLPLSICAFISWTGYGKAKFPF